jgi:hypothetical protein
MDDGTSNNRFQPYAFTNGYYLSIRYDNINIGDVGRLTTVTVGAAVKMCSGVTVNNAVTSVNGLQGSVLSSVTMPIGLTQMRIGLNSAATNWSNTTIRKIAYYDVRLTDAQINTLTQS